MSAKRANKQAFSIPDVWALCGLYALLLVLFVVPGVIIDGQPVSALQLMGASEPGQFGRFPVRIAVAREIVVAPILSCCGLLLTLLLRKSNGKYAFGAAISLLLFMLIGAYRYRALSFAGGFVLGSGMAICAALFFVSVVCAIIRR